MRRLASVLLFGALATVAACAPRTIALPVVTTPRFPDFIQRTVPPELAGMPVQAWLSGDDLKFAKIGE